MGKIQELWKEWKRKLCFPATPDYWNHVNIVAMLLFPVSAFYDLLSRKRRAMTTSHKLKVPVICVGNITMGGAGKTPVVLALANYLKLNGVSVGIISRGYGRSGRGVIKVDPQLHQVSQVGDEPLQLAQSQDVWVGKDKVACSHMAMKAGKQVILMDDGLQNASIEKTLSLLVIDGAYGLGNGFVFPAGPLREPLVDALRLPKAVIMIGDDETHLTERLGKKMVIKARVEPKKETFPPTGSNVVAFAGIGRPEKFFSMLKGMGYNVLRAQAFPDHYPYEEKDLQDLCHYAGDQHAYLLTTQKDFTRVPSSLKESITPCGINLVFDEMEAIDALLHFILHPELNNG
ncbi:MAG: tetraacyldisaccharide 4'-kinase [Alphaproteobacteria bacterium]|nr:tetraacyldisaccharide 4'-kinase [Alphaproteobacteria bacterium]